MTNDELEELDLIPANFYVIRKYINKYTNKNIPLLHSGAHVPSSLIHLDIEHAIELLKETDSDTQLILNDFSTVLNTCEGNLYELTKKEDKEDLSIFLTAYYRNVIRILREITLVVLFSLWNEMIFNRLTVLD